MNTDDPGDDVREHRLQEAEREAERGDKSWIVSIAIAICGPALVVAVLLWVTR